VLTLYKAFRYFETARRLFQAYYVINVSRNHSDVCRLLGRWCSLGASSGALVKYTQQQGAIAFDARQFFKKTQK
jgi:hypothetical protein